MIIKNFMAVRRQRIRKCLTGFSFGDISIEILMPVYRWDLNSFSFNIIIIFDLLILDK